MASRPLSQDALVAALAVGRSELSVLSKYDFGKKVRLEVDNAVPARADLEYLRDGLRLPKAQPTQAPGAVTLNFGPVRRLSNGLLALDAGVEYRPRGGFRAHYLVNRNEGPSGTVVKRTIFVEF